MLFCPNVAQTNAFVKMDILIKPLAFMDGEAAVLFFPEEIVALCQPF